MTGGQWNGRNEEKAKIQGANTKRKEGATTTWKSSHFGLETGSLREQIGIDARSRARMEIPRQASKSTEPESRKTNGVEVLQA